MKYLIVIASGLTDRPIAEKDNRTPLEIADTPHLDEIAQKGLSGSVQTIPDNFEAGNDVSLLSLAGYLPEDHHAGTAPFDALALDVVLEEGDVPLCCSFVQLQSSHNDMVMKDFTAGDLPGEDSQVLLQALQEQIGDSPVRFYPGVGPHNLMVIKSPAFSGTLNPPMELIGEGIRQFMPEGEEFKELVYIMNQAQIILHNHPYNRDRQRQGQDAVNSIWLWGNGERKALPAYSEKFKKSAALVSSSLLLKGIAKSAKIDVLDATKTNGHAASSFQSQQVDSALAGLDSHDVVYLHIADIENISLKGDLDDKVLAIEDFDRDIAGPLLEALKTRGDVKMLLVVNHVSSAALMKYTRDAVPFVVYPGTPKDATGGFDEKILDSGKTHFKNGPQLIEAFLQDKF